MSKILNIKLRKNIHTDLPSHNFFSSLSYDLTATECDEIHLDFSDVNFFASNQFAILGCILTECKTLHPSIRIYFANLNQQLSRIIKQNGFYKHFWIDGLPDRPGTIIPYEIFDPKEIKEYELYLTLMIFNRDDLPQMSDAFRHDLQDSLLEIFKNVSDHTSSQSIYTCGQYFSKSSLLYFTIVDSGETIPHNVTNYFSLGGKESPQNIIEWAVQSGTSTAMDSGPRGIGLYLIKRFIEANKGLLYIVSGNEAFEVTSSGSKTSRLIHPFPGTIVTLAFNLNDTSFYSAYAQGNVEIQF